MEYGSDENSSVIGKILNEVIFSLKNGNIFEIFENKNES